MREIDDLTKDELGLITQCEDLDIDMGSNIIAAVCSEKEEEECWDLLIPRAKCAEYVTKHYLLDDSGDVIVTTHSTDHEGNPVEFNHTLSMHNAIKELNETDVLNIIKYYEKT